MPPKRIKKKGDLKDEQLLQTVQLVKQIWPNNPITVNNIRNPTRDFVLGIYSDAMAHLDAKYEYITKTTVPTPPGLNEEELLFRKLCRVPTLVENGFKLGDMYVFEPTRVNSYILLIMHYQAFTEGMMDKLVQTSDSVFKKKNDLELNKAEIEALKSATLEKQIAFTTAKNENKKLKQAAEQISSKYHQIQELISQSEKKCQQWTDKMEQVQTHMQFMLSKIKQLEEAKLHLQNQVVTKEQEDSLKGTYKNLFNKNEELDTIIKSNDLLNFNSQLELLGNCMQELQLLDLHKDMSQLAQVRQELQNEKHNVNHLSLGLQNSAAAILKLKTEWDQELSEVTLERDQLEELLKTTQRKIQQEEQAQKDKYVKIVRSNEEEIEALKLKLQSKEQDLIRVKKGLRERWECLLQQREILAQHFENFLSRVEETLKSKK